MDPAVPAAPLNTTGILIVLLIGDVKFDPLTVNVTLTLVALEFGVTTTEDAVEEDGVALLITHEYVGLVTLVTTPDNVAFGGVNAPAEFCVKPVKPEISTVGPAGP